MAVAVAGLIALQPGLRRGSGVEQRSVFLSGRTTVSVVRGFVCLSGRTATHTCSPQLGKPTWQERRTKSQTLCEPSTSRGELVSFRIPNVGPLLVSCVSCAPAACSVTPGFLYVFCVRSEPAKEIAREGGGLAGGEVDAALLMPDTGTQPWYGSFDGSSCSLYLYKCCCNGRYSTVVCWLGWISCPKKTPWYGSFDPVTSSLSRPSLPAASSLQSVASSLALRLIPSNLPMAAVSPAESAPCRWRGR